MIQFHSLNNALWKMKINRYQADMTRIQSVAYLLCWCGYQCHTVYVSTSPHYTLAHKFTSPITHECSVELSIKMAIFGFFPQKILSHIIHPQKQTWRDGWHQKQVQCIILCVYTLQTNK